MKTKPEVFLSDALRHFLHMFHDFNKSIYSDQINCELVTGEPQLWL